MAQEHSPSSANTKHMIGLRAAVTVLERWKANRNQIQQVLRISRATLLRAKGEATASRLDCDQLERISIVLNMHATMRTVFENPANVYGFMGRPNDNEFFNGRVPLDLISRGSMLTLIETYRRVDSLRNGLW
ncbi:antitoxin Xre-like helix-turn-helix domain-containing protein [Halopseudomonas pelagia]|uniref:antitoxin Xre-like helix-turn-helix domain-containing protein n=1 Tax=Halopseudomonas pelagia TaxID=553151 RepID=UPI00397625DB